MQKKTLVEFLFWLVHFKNVTLSMHIKRTVFICHLILFCFFFFFFAYFPDQHTVAITFEFGIVFVYTFFDVIGQMYLIFQSHDKAIE